MRGTGGEVVFTGRLRTVSIIRGAFSLKFGKVYIGSELNLFYKYYLQQLMKFESFWGRQKFMNIKNSRSFG